MQSKLKLLLPLAVLILGALVTFLIVQSRPEIEKEPMEISAPKVQVLAASSGDVPLTVTSQGTVMPETEADLVAEVAGSVTWVSPSFVAGGYFRQGETLLRLDPRDYELSVMTAKSQLAQAKVVAVREEAEAAVAREEWNELGQGGEPSPLVTREPQLEEARARVAAAEASLARAELDLERTRIRAPFSGRLRAKRVDLGEFVNRGTPLATIYSVRRAEILLPVADSELEYLELPLGTQLGNRGPEVELEARFAGELESWTGKIVRTAGEIDPQTRMVNLVAQVDDPYRSSGDRPPLSVGLFVTAKIRGRVASSVTAIPRSALQPGDRVVLVDSDNLLRFRRSMCFASKTTPH